MLPNYFRRSVLESNTGIFRIILMFLRFTLSYKGGLKPIRIQRFIFTFKTLKSIKGGGLGLRVKSKRLGTGMAL